MNSLQNYKNKHIDTIAEIYNTKLESVKLLCNIIP